MGEFLFRFPAVMPKLDFDGLKGVDKIGTTVHVSHHYVGQPHECHSVTLYHTVLAEVYRDRVHFCRHGDQHMTTKEWLQQIADDNGIAGPGLAGMVNRRKFVWMLGDVPLEGATFPT